jgi:hypothetical protein
LHDQKVEDVCTLWVVCEVLRASRCPFPSGQTHVYDNTTVELWWNFFLLPLFFSLLTLGFASALPKIKRILSVCICINFGSCSFDCYLFYFFYFGWLRILLHNFFVFAFYGVIWVSRIRSLFSKISSIWLWSFFLD